jgi:hypothetical protein
MLNFATAKIKLGPRRHVEGAEILYRSPPGLVPYNANVGLALGRPAGMAPRSSSPTSSARTFGAGDTSTPANARSWWAQAYPERAKLKRQMLEISTSAVDKSDLSRARVVADIRHEIDDITGAFEGGRTPSSTREIASANLSGQNRDGVGALNRIAKPEIRVALCGRSRGHSEASWKARPPVPPR